MRKLLLGFAAFALLAATVPAAMAQVPVHHKHHKVHHHPRHHHVVPHS